MYRPLAVYRKMIGVAQQTLHDAVQGQRPCKGCLWRAAKVSEYKTQVIDADAVRQIVIELRSGQ